MRTIKQLRSHYPVLNLARVHCGMLTQHAGPGRVVFASWNGGLGYGSWLFGRRLFIPGFTLAIRLARGARRHCQPGAKPWPLITITRTANLYTVNTPRNPEA